MLVKDRIAYDQLENMTVEFDMSDREGTPPYAFVQYARLNGCTLRLPKDVIRLRIEGSILHGCVIEADNETGTVTVNIQNSNLKNTHFDFSSEIVHIRSDCSMIHNVTLDSPSMKAFISRFSTLKGTKLNRDPSDWASVRYCRAELCELWTGKTVLASSPHLERCVTTTSTYKNCKFYPDRPEGAYLLFQYF